MITVKRFTASWCGPCKTLAPIMETVKSQVNGVQFIVVDVDEQSAEAQKYMIRSVPTVVIESDGNEVQRLQGVQPASSYVNIINGWK